MYTCVYAYTCVYMYIHMCTHIHTHIHTCMCMYVYTCTCVHMCVYIHTFQQNRCASKIGFLTLQKQILHVQNRNFTRFCSKIRKFPILRAKMEFLTDCAWKHLKKIGYQSGDFHVARKSVQIESRAQTKKSHQKSHQRPPYANLEALDANHQGEGWKEAQAGQGSKRAHVRSFVLVFCFFLLGLGSGCVCISLCFDGGWSMLMFAYFVRFACMQERQ